jgi:hypothetical protein
MQNLKMFFLTAFLSQTTLLLAQSLDYQQFNRERLDFNKRTMTVLGGWAVGNIVVSGIMIGRTEGVNRGFHQMNAAWNAINLGIAGLGYWSAMRENPANLDAFQTIQANVSNQKVFLFNTALDVAYMAGGFYLMERSKNTLKNPDRLNGFGRAVVMNGAFLFALDATAYFLQSQKFDTLKPLVKEGSLGLSYSF